MSAGSGGAAEGVCATARDERSISKRAVRHSRNEFVVIDPFNVVARGKHEVPPLRLLRLRCGRDDNSVVHKVLRCGRDDNNGIVLHRNFIGQSVRYSIISP